MKCPKCKRGNYEKVMGNYRVCKDCNYRHARKPKKEVV